MKRRKALSLLLILTILLSLVLPATSALADDDTNGGDGDKTKGINISKTASYNENTKDYTITLEAFATGEKITSVVTKEKPTDIILVLDQSGSMKNKFSETTEDAWESYGKQQNSVNYDLRVNQNGTGNLWYKLADGGYVEVSVDRTRETVQDYVVWQNTKNSQCYNSRSDIYVNTKEGFKKVTVKYSFGYPITYTYTYTLNNDTVVTNTSTHMDGNPPYTIYRLEDTYEYTYRYYYKVNGVDTEIGTHSKGADTVFDEEFYKLIPSGTSISKLSALQTVVKNFADQVANKAKGPDGQLGTSDDVNHRIAIVGFASQSDYGYNTELLSISGNNSGSVGVAYDNISAPQDYKDVLQSMDTAAGQNMINSAIAALAAQGATQTDLGMTMAKNILDNNPVSADEERTQVVIVFTDGAPTSFSGFDKTVANNAITTAGDVKNKAKVYTIGIFTGADASSAGREPNGNLDDNSSQLTAACNWFMQRVSSGNGVPDSGYYLSSGDLSSLNEIFQNLSDNIQTGGSSTTLGSETVVKDIISPYFTLPKDANTNSIRLTTYDCTAKTGDTYTWGNPQDAKTSGVTADVNGNQVSVTGFNFSENWCGLDKGANGNETVRGKKLVISFEVEPKSGFLGGYSVDTNGGAYIYENADAKEPLMEFEKPKVDVTIPDVGVTATDKNVYLLGEVTLAQLKSGAVVKADEGSENGITIDLSKANDPNMPYGLEKWQTEYVDITVAVKDKDGKDVTDKIGSLTEDTTYKIFVTVSPKQGTVASGIGPTVTEKSGNATGNIFVFKPELTFVDSVAYYGDTLPEPLYVDNMSGMAWKHKGTTANEEAMGKAPELGISYASDSNNFLGDKINTKQDIPVKVDVTINGESVINYTTFKHECGMDGCTWTEPTAKGNPAFLVHVKTCTLTIVKAGNVANEPFVFTVNKDDVKYTEVTIVGADSVTIAELPVGTYSITEDTGWSWRYTPSYSNNGQAELTATAPTGTITCTNTKGNDQWLNDYDVISNIYGKPNTPATDGNN